MLNTGGGKSPTLSTSNSEKETKIKFQFLSHYSICEYKKYKRCQLRYDRQLNTFSSFVYLASLKILIKKVGLYII